MLRPHSQREESYLNLSSTLAICRSLWTLFGPDRALKAIQHVAASETFLHNNGSSSSSSSSSSNTQHSPTGSTIVSDSLHVLAALSIADTHSIGAILRSAVQAHYSICGNGVTSLVALVHAFSAKAQHLKARGHAVHRILTGFKHLALDCEQLCDRAGTHSSSISRSRQSSSRSTSI